MKKNLIVANWKCNPTTLKGAKLLFDSIKRGIGNIKNAGVVICPPCPYLLEFFGRGKKSQIKLGAQDCFWEGKGAFTGEVSPLMLKDLGAEYVILGHSERRKHLGETDEMINKKMKAVMGAGLKPILCVGDKSRKSKEDIKEIYYQLTKGLKSISSFKSQISNLIIVYEPIWAISSNRGAAPAPLKEVKESVVFIRKILAKLFDDIKSRKIRILYGGSVDSKNVKSFLSDTGMTGVLVGQASLNPQEFIGIVKAADSIV